MTQSELRMNQDNQIDVINNEIVSSDLSPELLTSYITRFSPVTYKTTHAILSPRD